MKNLPLISLIIPSYKREELLVQTLKCALSQDYSNLEIILVDQTPEHHKETSDYLDSVKDKIDIIYSEVASVTKAKNIGVKKSQGEFVIITDDDVSYDNSFITNHYKALISGADVVQGRILEKGSKIRNKPVWINWLGNFSGSDTCMTSGRTNNTTGCNCSFKRVVFDELNGWDENFYGIAIHEDSDFARRAFLKGYKFSFAHEAELFHYKSEKGGVADGIAVEKLHPSYIGNKLYFYRKNFSSFTYYYQLHKLLMSSIRNLIRLIWKSHKHSKAIIKK
jgi:glycosyltransferase involved in cell wall biosynthesis